MSKSDGALGYTYQLPSSSWTLRIRNGLSQFSDLFSEFNKYIAPAYHHDRCERPSSYTTVPNCILMGASFIIRYWRLYTNADYTMVYGRSWCWTFVSVQMRLYSMHKREFVMVFVAFFACFGLGVFIGLAVDFKPFRLKVHDYTNTVVFCLNGANVYFKNGAVVHSSTTLHPSERYTVATRV